MLWLRVGVLGGVDPNRYAYPNPNNNPNANPSLTIIVTLTPNLPWLFNNININVLLLAYLFYS